MVITDVNVPFFSYRKKLQFAFVITEETVRNNCFDYIKVMVKGNVHMFAKI